MKIFPRTSFTILVLLAGLCGGTALAQEDPDAGGVGAALETPEWFVLKPDNYTEAPGEPYPALLYLHGSGALRFDLDQLRADRFYESFAPLVEKGCLVIVPLAKRRWQETDVLAVLDEALAELPIDPSRVVLAGHSMGGNGTWRTLMAGEAGKRFAAASPNAAGFVPPVSQAPRFTGIPIWAVFGEEDHLPGAEKNREIVEAIQAAGGTGARFALMPGANHMESRNRFYADQEFHEWVLGQKRQR